MGDDGGHERDGGSSLRRIFHYLAYKEVPRRVGTGNIARERGLENSGFQNFSNQQRYDKPTVLSLNQLASALGYASLASLYPSNGKLPYNTERSIRKLYGIEETSKCWNYFRKRDPGGFIAEYELEHANVAGKPGDIAGEIENSCLKHQDILLVKGPPKAPEPCKIKGLAAVELFPAQIGRGTADIGFDISCGEARIFGVPVTIRIGEMAWDCGGGQLDPETRKGRGAAYQANNSTKLRWNGADTFKPAWRVEAEGASIGDLDVPPDFGTVIGLSPGCVITVTFGVWRPDIEEAEVADTNAVIAAFDAITIPVDVDSAAMSVVKKRIITRLATEAIERHGDFIVLCRHTVTFVAGPTE